MIPFAAEVSFRNRHLWIPLAVLWILLAALAVLALPLFLIGCLLLNVRPFCAVAVFWNILTSLNGTELSVDKPEGSFSVHLY
jgi:hypothetical protein